MAHFKTIRYKNILSTGNDWQEYNLEDIRLLLVIGKNGAGKTTLIDALFFALYGEAFRDVVKDKLINSVNKKELVVELNFSNGPTNYKIIRGIKPNVFEFYVDGNLVIRDANVKDYQARVQTALRIDKKSLEQQVILASRSYVPFMRLSANDRRSIIQDVLDIQVFSDMAKVTKTAMDELKQGIADLDSIIKDYSYKIDIERSKITVNRKNNSESIDRYERTNEVLRGQIDHLLGDIKVLTESTSDLDTLRVQARTEQTAIAKIENEVENLKREYKKHLSERKFYECNDSCPTCRQAIDEGFKTTIVIEKEEVLSNVADDGKALKEQFACRMKNLDVVLEKISRLETEYEKILRKQGEVRVKTSEINRNDEQIDNLKRESRVQEADQDLINTYQVEYNIASKKRTDLSNQLDLYKAASQLLKDDGIKTTIIRRYLPTINATINKFIRMMGFNVTFEMNETFKESITDQYGEVFSYHSFSEGEKMRFDLAILFTWREIAKKRNTNDTNLLIMDEVLDASLDADGAEDFMKIISEIVKETNTIIISHKSEHIRDKFEKVIEFKKVKKFSQMRIVK